MIGLLLLLALADPPPEPAFVSTPPRTNLVWDYSPTPTVTNYIVSISNQFGLFMAPVGNTNRWWGVLSNRTPTRVVAIAQDQSTLLSPPAVTNFFVQTQLHYEVFAQTGTISAGFADWKPMGTITNLPGLLFRLRAAVTVANQ